MRLNVSNNWIRWLLLAVVTGLNSLLCGQVNPAPPAAAPHVETSEEKRAALVATGLAEIGVTTIYDPAYVKLSYPGGDVSPERGVCTDVVIRALRGVGIDLQVLVHEDKKRAPEAYPHDYSGPFLDANIDHRRIPNLMVLFKREGKEVPLSREGTDYLPGDIIVWRLPPAPGRKPETGLLHMGLVTDELAPGTDRPLMVHNIGHGAQRQDALFAFTMVAHYRWFK